MICRNEKLLAAVRQLRLCDSGNRMMSYHFSAKFTVYPDENSRLILQTNQRRGLIVGKVCVEFLLTIWLMHSLKRTRYGVSFLVGTSLFSSLLIILLKYYIEYLLNASHVWLTECCWRCSVVAWCSWEIVFGLFASSRNKSNCL